MINFTKKRQIHILIIVGLLVLSYNILYLKEEDSYNDIVISDESEVEDKIDKYIDKEQENINKDKSNGYKYSEVAETIVVHIKGAVNSPGIVNAEQGERLIDIIDKAGGLNPEADVDRINLALKVEDEDLIHIPAVGEMLNDIENADETATDVISKNSESKSDLININKADKEELKRLSGVGEATAEKIIQHREENKFKVIEDIMEVPGIGDKKFEVIRDYITVR